MVRPSLLALALVSLAGCGNDCHDVPCGTVLIVELSAEEGFEDGSYEVFAESDLGSTTCTFTLADGVSSGLACTPRIADVDTTQLDQGFVLIRFHEGEPPELYVTIRRDEAQLLEETVAPEYEDVVVDSEACGGACRAGEVDLTLPPG